MNARMIDVMGLKTRVLESGDASSGRAGSRSSGGSRDTPVVMIHGVGGWAENFREVMEPIARGGRRAISVDLPGFGESESPGRVSHFGPTDAFYPKFMLALLDALGVDRAHLIGSSMGGAVAYMTAVTAPERVRSLTLAASGGLGTDIALFLRLATLPGMITLARLMGDRHQSRAVLRTCFFDAARIPEALYEESERFGFRSYPEFVRALRGGVSILGVKRGIREHWMAQATRYRGPALVVWGREDAVLPISHLAEAKAVYPQAEVVVIERCGHLPMIERTDEFLAALLPFVEGAEAAVAA
ncbi:MAG TPA: alpha/beta fold hydrolase [Methylomirabilota bacterium]|nr:alpha/beta fold hydrolase [Methylomirabilota bacterium]